ncbi:MAG: HD-GYP domain-containing protein [Halanaerobiaceae bacterium]
MRLVQIENINPEMKLARPVRYKNRILLNTGVNNLHKYKKRLASLGINYIYVNDRFSENIEVKDVIKDETRREGKKVIKEIMEDIKFNKDINIKKVKKSVSKIIDDILNNSKNLMVNMVDIKSFDSYTFEHSVNVAVLSIILGKQINLNKQDLLKLGTGAILHDIGKTLIPKDILNKSEKLENEEFEVIKKHPRLGYDYLNGNNQISPVSKIIILSHHERLNGSGYPKKISGPEIHKFGKIVAITDVYDALTSDRVYRKKWPVHKVINYLMSNTQNKFEPSLVKNFIRNLAVYPNGSKVKLSNGKKALIKEQHQNYPTRPVIKIIEDEKGNEVSQTIDLMDHLNIIIEDICQ